MTAAAARWADALLAAHLFARDPWGLGPMIVRSGVGPVRDRFVAALRDALPSETPVRKLPAGIDPGRLVGGLDLERTLATGRVVVQRGLVAEADGGVLLASMAERLAPETVSVLMSVIDLGAIRVEREGVSETAPARVGLVFLDEGEEGEGVAPALAERAAFQVDLSGIALGDCTLPPAGEESGDRVDMGEATAALVETAAALGIASLRPPLVALRVARMLGDDDGLRRGDLEAAARLVLAPRATRFPAPPEPPPPPPPDEGQADRGEEQQGSSERALGDMLVEAAAAALPPGVLAAMAAGAMQARATGAGAGARRKAALRGRPRGSKPGVPGRGGRLALVETLRAAAPWQRIRRNAGPGPLIRVHKSDLRVKRFEVESETTTIFLVDASGSAAAERLAEAKGAVELLLGEAYVRRTEVALIAFRGEGAELILPPTRSLTRAKRALDGLPGGGGTPLAAALIAGQMLALAARKRGRTPFLVAMTDGRANIALDGTGGRERATAEAQAVARKLRADGIAATLIDISARARAEASELAGLMGARYLPLPRADAARLSAAVRQQA